MATPISATGSNRFPADALTETVREDSASTVVTIEPVVIEADVAAQALVKGYDAGKVPACQAQAARALEGVVPLAGDFTMAVMSAAGGPVLVAAALANLFHSAFEEGGKLRAFYDCKTR